VFSYLISETRRGRAPFISLRWSELLVAAKIRNTPCRSHIH
jgi:hypothetical protein